MKRIVGLLPAVLLCAGPLFAQGNPYPNPPKGLAAEAGTIEGRVSYPNGKPVANVELQLAPESSWGTAATATTDAAGSFSFADLAVGSEYSLTGSVEGFKPIRQMVVVSGLMTYLNITLTRFPGQPIPPTATVPAKYANVPPEALEEFHRGVLARARGNAKEAEADFLKAVKIEPAFADAYMRLSAIYADQGRFGEAEKAIRKSLQLKKQGADGYAYLGYVYMREKHPAEAEAAFRKSIAISKDDWFAHLELGRLRYDEKRYLQAYPDLVLAHELHPQTLSVHLLLYDDLIQLGKDKHALHELDEVVRLFPNSPEAARLKRMRPALAAAANRQPN